MLSQRSWRSLVPLVSNVCHVRSEENRNRLVFAGYNLRES